VDLSQDYLLVDDPITVTYPRAEADVDYVQRSSITRADLEKNPRWILIETAVFHLWKAQLPEGFTPRLKDKIVHDGVTWLVESLEFMDRDANGVQRFRVVCIRSQT
jgi:hypothetical protein